MTVYNTNAMNHALNERGLRTHELAYRVDVGTAAIEKMFNGADDPGEVRLLSLVRIAETLGLPLRDLFAEPASVEPNATPTHDTTASDAHTVIALIYDNGSTPTVNTDLTAILGWDLDRLIAAYRQATLLLQPAGLRLYRHHGEVTIRPDNDHTQHRATLAKRRASIYGLKANYYQAIYQAKHGEKISVSNSTAARRIVLGALTNLGILDNTGDQPVLTAAATFATPDPNTRSDRQDGTR